MDFNLIILYNQYMFGYIVPEKPELKMREYEIYRGYYCGICKAIGKRHGQILRMTLNYDSVLLAMVIDGLLDEKLAAKAERCIAHPVQKRLVIKENQGIDYASDLHIILAYYKLQDDFQDDRSMKALFGMALLNRSVKKLMKKYEKPCIIIKDTLTELTALEKQKSDSLDMVSEQFALLMEAVFSGYELGEDTKRIKEFGFHLGKWIYTVDAYDDLEEDKNSGSYNPFLVNNTETIGAKQRAEFSLMYHLGRMSEILNELKLVKNREIIENILYLGMLKKTHQVLGVDIVKEGEEKQDESI